MAEAPTNGNGDRRAAWLAAAAVLLFSAVYLPALRTFFANDDWALIGFYGRVNPARFWEYFSPNVVWFYRPLQAMQFGLIYHAFGMNEVPGNVSLLVMHLGACALAFLLLQEVTGKPMLAAAMAALFSSLWIYVDILLWKANFNSLQWALLTLAACVFFSRYLTTRDRRWLWATYVACGLDFFAKESAVSTPLLLGLVWLCREAKAEDLRPGNWLPLARRGLALLWPTLAMTLAYVVLHQLLIRDAYVEVSKPGYSFSNPGQVLRQCLVALNHAVFSSYVDPVLLPSAKPLQAALALLVTDRWPVPVNLLLLPALLAAIVWRSRDRVLLFGIGFFYLSFVPMLFLATYHASRFYYLPGIGAAVIVVRLAQRVWDAGTARGGVARTLARIAVPVALAHLLIANVATSSYFVLADKDSSDQCRRLFQLVRQQRGKLEPGCVILLRNAPDSFFYNGLGVPEMARIALCDPTADGAVLGQSMAPVRIAALRAKPNYQIDLREQPMRVVRLAMPVQRVSARR